MTEAGYVRLRRQVLGLYVALHFAMLLPYAAELFSRAGVLPTASLSPLHGAMPGLLHLSDAPAFAWAVVGLGAAAGGAIALGVHVRMSALLAWLCWSSVFARNPLIANPSLPYVGLMLCMLAATPAHDARLRHSLDRVLWWAMAVGYSYSGLTKLAALSWRDGSALAHVLASPLARDVPWVDALRAAPQLCTLLTYAALALEVLFVPLSLWPRLRPGLWLGMLAMHAGLLLSVGFADLTLAMGVLHLFTWGAVRSTREARSLSVPFRVSSTSSGPARQVSAAAARSPGNNYV